MTDVAAHEIDRRFVPRARPDVAMVQLGAEIVLGRIADGSTFLQTVALNESGAIVWQCFDGSGTVEEIAADIADVFGADAEAVGADIETLAREVGEAGFLVGVEPVVIEVGGEPSGVAVGSPFPDFEAEDASGSAFMAEQLRGRRSFLVSWSPTCRFCGLIARDLADLVANLAGAGVDLFLLATGDDDANRESVAGTDLESRLLLLDEVPDGFADLGTPVAYLLDEEGNVAEALVLGATDVMGLASRIAARR